MPSTHPTHLSFARAPVLVLGLLSAFVLAGCGSTSRRVSYEPEAFGSTTTHTRDYEATEAQTCEAARRALLSQGYMITAANTDLVTGRKSFQPAAEVHVEVEFRVVCARENTRGGKASKSTVAFATALQDRYGIKKVNNSASLGVGAIGSLSLPFSSSDDAMVKVASETLTDERFYDRFFALLDRFLDGPEGEEEAGAPAETPVASPPAAVPAVTYPVSSSPNRG
ncbi:DUF2242 domain-containing protein [Variovorax sp. Root411]|uniref:DUF2242 domain-containing protein n=1 Tax=Variovorax sp. Root411 TaxID=1736530 RepID=UPI0006FADA63|nr:DUF2242 domain-containing protein [Variovorax sp. Root411]KQW61213.1 hypothetical protein ASC92_26940 [Variovorax sp. Root411]